MLLRTERNHDIVDPNDMEQMMLIIIMMVFTSMAIMMTGSRLQS